MLKHKNFPSFSFIVKEVYQLPDNANQQTFVIHKEPLVSPFLQTNKDSWKEVHRELKTGAAFSLWLWYSSNADGYSDDIYSITVQKELNIGKQTYYNARDRLIDYGYLIPDKEHGYEYHFYEKSPVNRKLIKKIKKNPKDEIELQNLYRDLIKQNKDIDDMTMDEWWLDKRGSKNSWAIDWKF